MGFASHVFPTHSVCPLLSSFREDVLTSSVSFLDDQSVKALEPGGSFTMGFVNQSLYTGDIDYQNIPDGQESYWILPLTGNLQSLTPQRNSKKLTCFSQVCLSKAVTFPFPPAPTLSPPSTPELPWSEDPLPPFRLCSPKFQAQHQQPATTKDTSHILVILR